MEFSFGFSAWWLLPIVGAAAALAWWMYRPARDQAPMRWRWLLTTLRFLVLLTAAALLLQPLISTQRKVVYPPLVVFLQDNSESMVAHRDSAFVRGAYPDLFRQFQKKFEGSPIRLETYSFGASLQPGLSVDSLAYDQGATALSNVVREARRLYENQNLAAIVLVSDGIPTQGGNPIYAVEGMQQPLFTVWVGDTAPQQDIRIRETLYNEIAYLKEEMPVKVLLESSGFPVANLTVTLTGNGKTLASQVVSLTNTRNRTEVNFSIRPETAGLQTYIVSLTRLPQEITYRNNVQTLFVNVLETRVKIALLAGGPHPDLGALKQAFEREDRYQLDEFVLRQPGVFIQNTEGFVFADYDLLMLHNFPRGSEDRASIQKVAEFIQKSGKPVLFWVGPLTDLRTLAPLYEFMALAPVSFNVRAEEIQANFLPAYQDHASFTFDKGWLSWINTAPPLQRNMSDWQPKPGAEVFATVKIKNVPLDYPLFAFQNQLNRKNMVFLGDGFWRLRADAYLDRESFEAFDDWLFNCVKWLMASDDKRKFRVDPARRQFSGQESALFRAQVYDDSYNPVPGAEVKMSLRGPDGASDYFFGETYGSQYSLEISQLPEGAYTYEAVGAKNGREIGKDRGQFSVGRSNVEHIRLQADLDLLEQLALRTGGVLTPARELPGLADQLRAMPDAKPVSEFQRDRLGLYEIGALLALLLILLSAEWIIRKVFSLS